MICRWCKTFLKTRPLYLAHVAVCMYNENVEEMESDESEFHYDSDKDPAWEPEGDDLSNEYNSEPASSPLAKDINVTEYNSEPTSSPLAKDIHVTEYNSEPASSPLTQDQIETAQLAESMLSDNVEPEGTYSDPEQTLESVMLANTKRSKRNYCRYCNKFQSKISRHFVTKHKDVQEIQVYMNLTDENKKLLTLKKREACKKLINLSNQVYNEKVTQNPDLGKPIPVKKTKLCVTSLTHIVCSGCGAYISRKYFFSHKGSCLKRDQIFNLNTTGKSPTSGFLLPPIDKRYLILREKIFPKMKKDEITILAQNDSLILEYGRRFQKSHMSDNHRNYVSCRMRTLGDLVLKMKKLKSSITCLKDCLNDKNFDCLCNAIKTWSKYNENTGVCSVGSVPRRIFKSLKVCAGILLSLAIRSETLTIEDKENAQKEHDRFIHLMTNDWSMEINSVGDSSLKQFRNVKNDESPPEEDILTFCTFMKQMIKKLSSQLKVTRSINDYNSLTKHLLAFLTLFNGRRPSEVSNATVTNYESITPESKYTSDGDNSISVFTVCAPKNGVKVPIVIPRFAKIAVDMLLTMRPVLNVQGSLLLSKIDGSVFNTTYLISLFKSKLNLDKPNSFSANGLRHYWATMSQKYPEIKKHMPKHLGHTTLTHEKFYEKPLSDIHLNVIGPVLLEKCLPVSSTKTAGSLKESDISEPSETNVMPSCSTKTNVMPSCTTKTNVMPSCSTKTNVMPSCSTKTNEVTEESDTSDSSDSFSSPVVREKNRWITPEKDEIFKGLPETILGLANPGRGKVKNVWENSRVIRKRHSLQMMRIEVSKYFNKKKTISTPDQKRLFCYLNENK